MRIAFLILVLIGVLVAIAYLAAKPSLERRATERNRPAEQPGIDPRDPRGMAGTRPPVEPRPGEARSSGPDEVPPGSRPDRERHGKL